MAVRLILQMMVKNESKIVARLIRSVIDRVDAVSMLDTGSTDATMMVCDDVLAASGKPYQIKQEPFINFGRSRSRSFAIAVDLCDELGWDRAKTFTLAMDADMVAVFGEKFADFILSKPGYTCQQNNGSLRYHNIRFMRCDVPWVSLGATHEYWSGPETEKIPPEIFYIDDRDDGGCKSDKSERDIRLLLEDLRTNPKNCRTYFYLAQTYLGCGQYAEAIKYYKLRITMGGFFEEVWYSHYQIAACYENLGRPEKMEAWALRAFALNPRRSEPLYLLTKYFRVHGDHYKAYAYYLKGRHIPLPSDLLFVNHEIYDHLFEYENTILAYYISRPVNGLLDTVAYLNRHVDLFDSVFSNMFFYIKPLAGSYTSLPFPDIGGFHASSISVCQHSPYANIRYVDYVYGPNLEIVYLSGRANTINAVARREGRELTYIGVVKDPPFPYTNIVTGLEDVRLCGDRFSASTRNFRADGRHAIVHGVYSVEGFGEDSFADIEPIESPTGLVCEKNWIYIPGTSEYIHAWHPLQIYSGSEKRERPTPAFFSRVRGSSNLWWHNDAWWCVVHIVKYGTPRTYAHCLVSLDADLRLVSYSLPFYFRSQSIEYCLGLMIDSGPVFFISEKDATPGRLDCAWDAFHLIKV